VLGTLAIVQQAGQRTPVLVIARSVQAGQVISAADVRVAELGVAPGVASLAATARGRVVGRRAAVPLEEGQVLSPAVVADGPALDSLGRLGCQVAWLTVPLGVVRLAWGRSPRVQLRAVT
jgi:Flp pilus assembly protein CpaB